MTLKTLGEIARFINGAAFKPVDWEEEGLPIIRIQNLTGTGERFNYTNRQVRRELIVEPGDLLVSWSATLDVYKWTGTRGVLNQHIFKVLPGNDVNPDYLFFALKKALAEFTHKSHGSTMKHVVRGDFESTRVRVPSLDEQRRIVDILNSTQGIRKLRRQASDFSRQLIPALFVKMFGDPATNPMGWEIKTVGEVLSVADYGTSVKASEAPIGVPVLRMGNVTVTGKLLLDDLKYAEFPDKELAKLRLELGDILFNRTNSKDLVGKTGLWDGRFEAVAASYFIRLRTKREIMSPVYFWVFFNSRFMKQRLYETARGAIGQSNINTKELKAFTVPIPPLSLQQEFADRVLDIEGMIANQNRMAAEADTLAASLLNQMLG